MAQECRKKKVTEVVIVTVGLRDTMVGQRERKNMSVKRKIERLKKGEEQDKGQTG